MKIFCYLDVGFVILLCDGMNLVVKEFVVVQDFVNSGVLVLLQFVGVVNELMLVLIVNFYDWDDVVVVFNCVLMMFFVECILCYVEMLDVIVKNDINCWQECFIYDLKEVMLCSFECQQQNNVVMFFKLV